MAPSVSGDGRNIVQEPMYVKRTCAKCTDEASASLTRFEWQPFPHGAKAPTVPGFFRAALDGASRRCRPFSRGAKHTVGGCASPTILRNEVVQIRLRHTAWTHVFMPGETHENPNRDCIVGAVRCR